MDAREGNVGGGVSPARLLGVHHLEGERVGRRLVDVDEADEDRCLVVGAPDDHLEVALGDPGKEVAERAVVLRDRHHLTLPLCHDERRRQLAELLVANAALPRSSVVEERSARR
jgi:hypothetical protein